MRVGETNERGNLVVAAAVEAVVTAGAGLCCRQSAAEANVG